MKLIKKIGFQIFSFYFKRLADEQDAKIPNHTLQHQHLSELTMLPNRESLLEKLSKGEVVAEIGVDKGEFSEKIMNICQPRKLHLIDAWGSARYNKDLKHLVERKFKKEITSESVIIHEGYSVETAQTFEEKTFDWIYIDTDHSYTVTLNELYAYSSKLKDGGLILGHDYIIGNWNGLRRYGVIEAVAEFCVKENWKLIYLTADQYEKPSFAIKKI